MVSLGTWPEPLGSLLLALERPWKQRDMDLSPTWPKNSEVSFIIWGPREIRLRLRFLLRAHLSLAPFPSLSALHSFPSSSGSAFLISCFHQDPRFRICCSDPKSRLYLAGAAYVTDLNPVHSAWLFVSNFKMPDASSEKWGWLERPRASRPALL